ncbi:hypothetical protein F7725_004059 [Dissostichus mawsoni]|uniref:Uncharacterized protein n=1 Tax=Dissostichus mawsoni TaxID=36200 RepID=A0A7J5YDA3_DISMA|nr:hypothetical protein F7725_004059 [Dissostichus mawsoni]
MHVGLEGNILGEKKVEKEERDERKHGDGGKIKQEEEVEVERQNKMKEDEGGGKGEIDKRECRCSHHAAVTSGLLSAMMILSTPVLPGAAVHSGIGLQPDWTHAVAASSKQRRDQSHRHTRSKCWESSSWPSSSAGFLPCGSDHFHSFSGRGSDRQETHTDTHLEMNHTLILNPSTTHTQLEYPATSIETHTLTHTLTHTSRTI